MILFLKTLAYDLRPVGVDAYNYLTQLGLQQIDPPSLQPAQLKVEANYVLHSPLRRVVESIEYNPQTVYRSLPALREMPFDLTSLCSRDEWVKSGSLAVRRQLKQSFIDNTLPVSRDVLLEEAVAVLWECANLISKGYTVAVVSHSFRLKLIEAYIMSQGRLRNNPDLIHEFIKDSDKTYPFGGGFTADELSIARLL